MRVLGIVQIFTKRAAQGIAECERALALDHNFATAHALIGLGKVFSWAEARKPKLMSTRPFGFLLAIPCLHLDGSLSASPSVAAGADAEAVVWLRRSLEANRNYPLCAFLSRGRLALLGELDEAQAAVQAGLALDPIFTIRRYRDQLATSELTASRERIVEGMRSRCT